MGFFKKDEIEKRESQTITEIKEVEKSSSKTKNLALLDVETIGYVIENFPSMSIEIQSGLNNLADILEDTINYIEDESCEVIKNNRDFKTSKSHRDTSMAVYGIVKNIKKYVKWMQHECEKDVKEEDDGNSKKLEMGIVEIKEESKNESLNKNINFENGIEIYKDFSLKEPKAFRLDDNLITVENWEDLLIKTAEVLTKQYRKSKDSDKVIKDIKPIEKKSTQNSFRDTAMEMLLEYKINFDEYKVII